MLNLFVISARSETKCLYQKAMMKGASLFCFDGLDSLDRLKLFV